jgi:zinc-ribbon domain
VSESNPSNKFCVKCGAPLTPDATFCAKCGTPVAPTSGPSATPPPMWDRHAYRQWRRQARADYRYEKYEKHEKQEKREKHEKGRGGSIISPIMGALVLIWLGTTLYLQQINYIPSSVWWAYFIAGVGIIIIAQGIMRYLEYHGPYVGSAIGGAILFLIGLAFITGLSFNFWPLLLVAIGVALIVSAVLGRRNRPAPTAPPPPSA